MLILNAVKNSGGIIIPIQINKTASAPFFTKTSAK
jgi:hypothetical protein